jgi:AsmA-like C-terminal region
VLCGLAALLVLAIFVGIHWPYRHRQIKPLLERVFASQIEMRSYRRLYFPHPGFVAEGITLRRDGATEPLGTARQLVVEGTYLDMLLLRRRVRRIDVDGMEVVIPAPGTKANQEDFPPGSSRDFSGPNTVVEYLILHNARLELLRRNGGKLEYDIHDLQLRNVQEGQPASFAVSMTNSIPVGDIEASGSVGPIPPGHLDETKVSGKFTFAHGRFDGIAKLHGALNAKGDFEGTLDTIQVNGSMDSPDFHVKEGHGIHVRSEFKVAVDATNGEVQLRDITAHAEQTTIRAHGSITGSPRVTQLDIRVDDGRVQDLLRPFVQGEIPATGLVNLRAHAALLPVPGDFFKRLRMNGSFDIPQEQLTDASTEEKLSDFSRRAVDPKAEDPPGGAVDPQMDAVVRVVDGVAQFPRLTCHVPGASMELHGTYGLRHQQPLDMRGDLRMERDISHATTGWKSMLLKPLAPIFHRQHAGAVVPVMIAGTRDHYTVHSNMLGPK